MLLTVRARPSRPGSLQRSAIPRGAPLCRRVHCTRAHEDAAPAPSSSQQPVPPDATPPAKPVVPTGGPKDPAKAKQSVKRFLERVEGLGAGQRVTERLLREVLEGQAYLAAALERGLTSMEAASREDVRTAQAALAEAAAGLQKAVADAQQQAAAQALERVAQLEAELAATRKDAEAAQGRDREALGQLGAELAALRSKVAETTLEAEQCAARNRQLEVELSALHGLALHEAIRHGRLDEVRRLIAGRADVDYPGSDGITPLMRATNPSYTGYLDNLTALLEAGADVAATNKAGQAVLHWSMMRHGTVEVARRLIQAGADVNAIDMEGNTPLHHAARRGHTRAVRLLLEAGAERNVHTKGGMIPYMLAPCWSSAEALLQPWWGL